MLIKDAIVLRLQKICDKRDIKYNELTTLSGVTPSTVYSLMSLSRREWLACMFQKLLKKRKNGLIIS